MRSLNFQTPFFVFALIGVAFWATGCGQQAGDSGRSGTAENGSAQPVPAANGNGKQVEEAGSAIGAGGGVKAPGAQKDDQLAKATTDSKASDVKPAVDKKPAADASAGTVALDPALPDYKPVQGVSGSIKSVGSDTMNNLMTLWSEGFHKHYPSVRVEIEGKGSSTAPPALIGGTATFGPMSREMKSGEIDEFEKKFGYKPVALPTSIDMLAVYVNKDNPLKGLTLPEADAIFSQTRKLGHEKDISSWGQLELSGDWANAPISLYGRNSASGTYGYFKEHVLGKGDYKDTVKEQPGSSSVVQAIASDKYAIGYSGIGYKTADVRALPLAKDAEAALVPAEPEHAYTGDYPLSRYLWLYMNYQPNSELDPLRREFIKYVFSRQGQEVVVKDGYYPVNAAIAKNALQQVGIE